MADYDSSIDEEEDTPSATSLNEEFPTSANFPADNSIQVSVRASLVKDEEIDIVRQGGHVTDDDSSPSAVSFKWSVKYSLFKLPIILGVLALLLIATSCSFGLTGLLLDSSSNKYLLYFGIGVTVSGIFTSITETFIVSSGITALIKLKEMDEVKRRSSIELEHVDNSVYSTQDANKIDVDLQKPSRFDEFYIFLGFTIFNISFNLIYWGIAITQLQTDPPYWILYILVDVLIGIVSPMGLCISVNMFGTVGRKLTRGQWRSESLIPAVLTFVKYNPKSDKSKYPFWSIVDFFYFPVYPNEGEYHAATKNLTPFLLSNSRLNLPSTCLLGMVSITFCLSMAYIVRQLLTGELSVYSCSEVVNQIGYDCFEHFSKSYVNCSSGDTINRELDCFRFNRIGFQSDPIQILLTAMFLYLACDKFLTVQFKFVRELFKIYPSKVWGLGVMVFGLMMLAVWLTCFGVYVGIHSVYFDFQRLLQLLIISTDIFLSGVLLFNVKYIKRDFIKISSKKAPPNWRKI